MCRFVVVFSLRCVFRSFMYADDLVIVAEHRDEMRRTGVVVGGV